MRQDKSALLPPLQKGGWGGFDPVRDYHDREIPLDPPFSKGEVQR